MEAAKLKKRLKELFNREFPDSRFLPETSEIRLGGTLLWDGFAEMDQVERQRSLWRAIKELNEADQSKISLIVTFTFEEYEIIKAESA